MPTHGEKRLADQREEIFHTNHGWISIDEFYDLPELTEDDLDEDLLGPDYLERQHGESFDHYKKRLHDINEYNDREVDE